MKKSFKSLVLFIVMAMLFVAMAVTASAETWEDFRYSVLEDGTIKITKYLGNDVVVNIPDQINGSSVTTIGTYAFYDTSTITEQIFIPKTIKNIEEKAFVYCYSTKFITVDEENEYYCNDNYGALYNEDKTELIFFPRMPESGNYTVPASVERFSEGALNFNAKLMYLDFAEGAEYIYANPVVLAINLRKLTFPSSAKNIVFAADQLLSLTTVVIPDGVERIEGLVLNDGAVLEEIYIKGLDTVIDTMRPESTYYIYEDKTDKFLDTLYDLTYVQNKNITFTDEPFFEELIGECLAEGTRPVVIYCHSGSTAEAYAIENGLTYELTHFFEGDWNYDYDQGIRSRKCIHCDELETEAIGEENLNYDYIVLENGTVEITKYKGSEDSPVIPDTIEGKKVTSIGNYAFSNANIKSIVIPDSVENIGERAFYDCLSLETVDLGDGIRSIAEYAFYGCYNLKAVDLGNSVRSIGEYAFTYTDIRSIVIPDSVESISNSAFYSCYHLETVDLGDGVTTIGGGAFDKCYSLKEFNIGKSLKTIEYYLFYSSFALEKITVDPENETFYSDEYGVVYQKDTKALLIYPASAPMTSYKIAEGTEIIAENAFHDSMYLKELSFPESLHTIEMAAFIFSSGIETFTIPETVKYVGEGAFGYCFALKEVYVLNPDIEFDGMIYASNGIIADGVTSLDVAEVLKEKDIARRNGETEKWQELEDKFYTYLIAYDDYFTDAITIYCHDDGQEYTAEGQREYGTPVVRYHTYAEEWTYDWENYVRYRECTFENCNAVIEEALEREETGDVEIVAPVDPDTDFEVDNVEKDSDSYILVQDALSETDYTLLKAFDITLKNKDGVHVQPNGTVKVKLPHKWEKNGNYKVYRVNEDGTLTDMNAYRQGSHMVFETDHFSIYIIVEEKSDEAPEEPAVPEAPEDPSKPEAPEKNDLISKIFDLLSDLINLLISLFSNAF